jgi:hypothetical protein
MKNIQDVLREKETAVEKLTREIKLLRAAVRMLEDDGQKQTTRTADQSHHQVETAITSEDPVLDLSPVPAPTNGDNSKRWP